MYSTAVQPDGKIYVAGSSQNFNGIEKIAIVRLNSDGTPDPTFGSGGSVTTVLSQHAEMAMTLNLQPDGKLVVAGMTGFNIGDTSAPYTADFAVLRYNPNGTLDSTFGKHGIITTDFINNDLGLAAVIQPDGKILVGGVADYNHNHYFALARYEANAFLYYNTINGSVFLDGNANNIKDAGEPFFNDARIVVTKYSRDTMIITTANGQFTTDVDTGAYAAMVVPDMLYYTATPAFRSTYHLNYFNTDSLSFAVQPVAGKRDVAIHVIPSIARPGFDAQYHLFYTNQGTDTVAGGVIDFVKSSRLTFNSASTVPSYISGDTLRWVFAGLKPLDTAGIIVNCTVQAPPVVNIGDTLHSTASITTDKADITPADNAAMLSQRVLGSYDPNDKSEIHGGSITKAQVNNGNYLQYTIRFQNTGSDTAFNVYVRDTLESKLDWSTMRMIDVSHSFQLNVTDGNRCVWTFKNINLVDSNHNESLSHGYLTYIIKAKPTVPVGDVISNTASIYFDYNLPVVTNTQTTNVVSEVLPLRLLAFTAVKEASTNRLQWATTTEINVDRFQVERSSNGREFSSIATVKAGFGNYSYTDAAPIKSFNYYRLKMIDIDGRYSYSLIRMVDNTGSLYVTVYPNPAKDRLHLQINSDKEKNVLLQVISRDRKVTIAQRLTIPEGTSVRSLNVSSLPAGNYYLQIGADDKEVSVVPFEKI